MVYKWELQIPKLMPELKRRAYLYLPAGYDATVSNTKDMVFRNILPYDIRIEFESKDGVMTAFMFRDYDE